MIVGLWGGNLAVPYDTAHYEADSWNSCDTTDEWKAWFKEHGKPLDYTSTYASGFKEELGVDVGKVVRQQQREGLEAARDIYIRDPLIIVGASVVPAGLKIIGPKSGKLNAPHASDPVLEDVYKNLWRPEDARAGGTIGELLRETQAGGELRHLEKARGRLRQLVSRVTDTSNPLSAADRAGAERVINDLKDAIRIAEGR